MLRYTALTFKYIESLKDHEGYRMAVELSCQKSGGFLLSIVGGRARGV